MPFVATDDGVRLHYQFDGPQDAPVLVLSNSLGTNFGMWDAQIPALSGIRRVLRYDTRGHGQSSVAAGSFGIERLGRDVLAVLDAVGAKRAEFCGLSMGGLTGIWLGQSAPERFSKLVLCNTGACIGEGAIWSDRINAVRNQGMGEVAKLLVARWFTAAFPPRNPAEVRRIQAMVQATPPAGYIHSCEVLRDTDLRPGLGQIRLPVLVISGAVDPATPPELGRFIAAQVPGARHVELPAAHLSNVEAAAEFNAALTGFLA